MKTAFGPVPAPIGKPAARLAASLNAYISLLSASIDSGVKLQQGYKILAAAIGQIQPSLIKKVDEKEYSADPCQMVVTATGLSEGRVTPDLTCRLIAGR